MFETVFDDSALAGSEDGGTDLLWKLVNAGGGETDLDADALRKIQKLCLMLFRKNSRAFSSTEALNEFAIGDEAIVQAQDSRVQELLDRHWRANGWAQKLEERSRALSIYGEQLYPVFADPITGMIRLTSVSPLHIRRVLRNPEDAEDFVAVVAKVRGSTEVTGQMEPTEERDDEGVFLLLKDEDIENPEIRLLNSEYLEEQRQKYVDRNGKPIPVFFAFYYPINRVAGSSRGQPDHTAIVDWLEGVDSFSFTMLERAELAMQIVFDLEYEGLEREELNEKAVDFMQRLRTGEVFTHNEKVKLDVKGPELASSEAGDVFGILLRNIQAGTRFPGFFYGDSADLSRASAGELAIPASKRISKRQRYLIRVLRNSLDLQIAYSKFLNQLSAEDTRYELKMPQALLKDLAIVSKSLGTLAEALESAERNQYISKPIARKLFLKAIHELNLEVVDEELEFLRDAGTEGLEGENDVDEKTKELFNRAMVSSRPTDGSGDE